MIGSDDLEIKNYVISDKLRTICSSDAYKQVTQIKSVDTVNKYIIDIYQKWIKILIDADKTDDKKQIREYLETEGMEEEPELAGSPFKEIEKYDVVINAIGAIKQRGMSKDHLYLLNTELPKILAKKLIDTESRVIHFTTDCVFQGDRNNLKTERTPHDATDDYGKSKSLGEISQHNFWNLRASFIGAETNSNLSLLNWFLNQKMGALIDGYVNHIWNGITVVDYAMIISRIVEHSAFPENRVLHLIPADEISKYDLLKMFGRYFDREDIIVNKYSGSENVYRKIDTDFPAQNLNLWNLTGRVKLPSIEELIAELALEYKSRNYFVGKQFRRTD
jgi:dTDP-4-dehydrorhamnose reductase